MKREPYSGPSRLQIRTFREFTSYLRTKRNGDLVRHAGRKIYCNVHATALLRGRYVSMAASDNRGDRKNARKLLQTG